MATAIKRGKGRSKCWYAQWGNGRRGDKTRVKLERAGVALYCREVGKVEAVQAANELAKRYRQGRGPSQLPALTWGAAVQQYLDYCKQGDSGQSHDSRRRKIKPWKEHIGEAQTVDGNPSDVRLQVKAYLAKLQTMGRSPATVNGYRVACSGLFAYLLREDLVTWHYNPAGASYHALPARTQKVPEVLYDDVLDQLAAAMKATTCETAYLMFRWTGMRMGEMLDVEWSEVDLAHGKILANKTKTHRDREVPIAPDLAAHLVALPRRSPWVCCSPRGLRWGTRNFQRSWDAICKAADLPANCTHRHALRRTSVTKTLLAGETAAIAAEIHGHSIQTMMKYYANLKRLQHTPKIGGTPTVPAAIAV